jgi:hypothetical protein
LVAVIALAACSERERPEPHRELERQRRVIEPPSGRVRPLPPHAIRADGVGPYRLGAALTELLDQLPSGPRIETIDIPRVVHQSVLRAEDGTIIVGGEPLGKATFVAVVGGEVARTESGIHVGSTRDEIVRALGAPLEDPERPRDPRLLVPSGLRNARILLDDDRERAVALVITGDDGGRAGATTAVDPAEMAARADAEKVLARVPGLVFWAPLHDALGGHDELVAIARIDEPPQQPQQRTWTLRTFRLDGTRFVSAIEPVPVYQLTAANARWIGADLQNLELYLEVRGRSDALEVGGLLTTRIGEKLRDVVVISPFPVPRPPLVKRAKPASTEPTGANTSDAAAAAPPTPNEDHRAAP